METFSRKTRKHVLLHVAVLLNKQRSVSFLVETGIGVDTRLSSDKELLDFYEEENMKLTSQNIICLYRTKKSLSLSTFQPSCISSKEFCTLCSIIDGENCYDYSRNGNKDIPDNLNPTPLHMAVAMDNCEMAELLLKYGADVNAKMHGKFSALVLAIVLNKLKMAKLLIEYNASVNARFSKDKTPMHFAVQSKQIQMVELLIKNGGEIDARTHYCMTPLHLAIDRKLVNIAKLLLDNGSDVNATTNTGVTPLHLAAVKGQCEIIELILNYGGDFGVIVKGGKIDIAPLLWNTETDRKYMTELLQIYFVKAKARGFCKLFKKIWENFKGESKQKTNY